MKTKLLVCLVLFFAFSIISSSDPRPDPLAVQVDSSPAEWPGIPGCSSRDDGTGKVERGNAGAYAMSAAGNPLESAFLEVSCLLAAN